MKQIIHYHQMIPILDENGEQTGAERVKHSIEVDDTDPSYNDYIRTIQNYCGDDYRIVSNRTIKYEEFDSACENAIISGIDVDTSHGSRRFTFSLADQNNINDAANTIRDAESGKIPESVINGGIPFKAADGECLFYSKDDINKIDLYKKAHILYHRTYLSALIALCDTLDDNTLSSVRYGDTLPAKYQAHVNEVMAGIRGLMNHS